MFFHTWSAFFVIVYISGHKKPTGHVELSHKLGQGSCWSNWSRNFQCGHSFLYSTNWVSGWAKHLEMWRPRAVRSSLSLSSDPGALDQVLSSCDRGNQAKNIEENKSFNERLPLEISIAQRSELLFEIYATSSNLQRKSNSLQSVVHCRHTNVCYFACQHAHLSASSLPMKSLDRVEGYHCLHKFHHAASGLT